MSDISRCDTSALPFPPSRCQCMVTYLTQVLFPSSVGYAKFLIKKRQVIVK